MGQMDWDPDDLLDFDYGRPVNRDNSGDGQSETSGQSSQKDFYEELKEYEALRNHHEEQAEVKPASSRVKERKEALKASRKAARKEARKPSGKSSGKAARKADGLAAGLAAAKAKAKKISNSRDYAEPMDLSGPSDEETNALRQAQQEAYERYRSTYDKNTRKKNKPRKAGLLTRGLSWLYVAAAAIFAVVMTIIDVLPFGMLIALYAVLGLLSLIIVIQLRKDNIRRWVRVAASLLAIVLIAGYGIGSAYAMGTLSFLNFTSVKNDKKVASITKVPFNVCMTGIDVNGKIDKEGRSDVNMIVTVNPNTEQILLTSIPRDYQIYMPDKDMAMDKLTHTGFYGIDCTIGAEENLLDTQINYFVKVNFSTVKKFIDAIGGIDVYSEYSFNPVKLKSWTVQEGMNHMNGKQALAFARERKAFATGDNQRIKNQQAVFEAMIKKATSSKTMLLSYNKIISNLRDYFKMSISSAEMRAMIKLQLAKDPQWKIYKNSISGGDGSLPTYSTGGAYAYVMTQDQMSIDNAKTLINGVLSGKLLDKDDDGNVYVVGGDDASGEASDGSQN